MSLARLFLLATAMILATPGLSFADMNADPVEVMRRVYGFLGLGWSEEVERRQQSWLARSRRRGDHGRHRYSLQEFGLTERDIAAAFPSRSPA